MEEVKRNSLRAWILAARPKTLTGAVTPVLIGTALAAMDGHFHWLPALICCLFASLMQIAANFINDLFDFLKGQRDRHTMRFQGALDLSCCTPHERHDRASVARRTHRNRKPPFGTH